MTTDDTYAGIPVRRNLFQCADWQRMAEDLMAFQDTVQEALSTEGAGDVLQAIARLQAGIVHRAPAGGFGLMPCCGRTPFEMPRTDRVSGMDVVVTCRGVADVPR